MKIIVLGAAHIGRALVEALYEEHEITRDRHSADRLATLSDRYDVRTVEGDGTTERVIRVAGVDGADLFIGCSPREEANLVGAMLAKRLSGAQTIVRTPSAA
jgi:trk/ktr system potassium uptake protein